MKERIDPETLAYTLVEHAADVCGEDAADAYLVRIVAEVLAIAPGVLGHVVDKWFTDLAEELGRRGEQDAVRAVTEVQTHWEQEV
jgi:hypothetical protein